MERNQPQSTRRVITLAANLAVVTILSVAFLMKNGLEREKSVRLERDRAQLELSDVVKNLASKLNDVLLVASSFSGAIALDPEIGQSEYSRFASTVAQNETGIVNIAAIRDFRIELVYPLAENLHLVGKDLREVPDQLAVVEQVRDSGEGVLQGPVRLLQGYDGFILRYPVNANTQSGRQFWGLVSIVFSAEGFFEEFGLDGLQETYELGIRNQTSGAAVFGDDPVFSKDAVFRSIAVPGNTWQIALYPKSGWSGAYSNSAFWITSLLTLALMVGLTNYLLKQRENALRSSEQLHAAINALGDGFVLYDEYDRISVCNEKHRELSPETASVIVPGARFEDILRYGLDRKQYPDAIGREEQWLNERMAAHLAADSTVEQELKDGRWLRIREMPTPDGGRVGIRIDITEQVEARRRIQIAEGRLRDAINAVPAGFWLFDADLTLEIANARALEPFPEGTGTIMAGETIEQVIDHLLALELPEDTTDETVERRRKQLSDFLLQDHAEFEVRIGKDRWFRYHSQRTREGGLVCFGVEITEVKRHEKSLQRSNDQMQEALRKRDAAETRFADVADSSTEWLWEQDRHHRMAYVSPGFVKATGVRPREVLGAHRSEIMTEGAGDTDIEDPRAYLLEKMDAHEPFSDVIYKPNLSLGQETWFRTSGKPKFDDDGEFSGYIGTASDVTPLYSALREARRADEAKTQFLNVISHELRTPMTIVLGFNAFLLNLDTLPEFKQARKAIARHSDLDLVPEFSAAVQTVETFAGKIQVAGEQLQKLIQDVLDLSRIDAKTLRVDLAPVEADDVVTSIIEQVGPLVEGKDIEFRSEIEKITLWTDEVRLRQILINLVSNAVKYTDSGQVTVRAWQTRDDAVFEVEDTGVGIPIHALESIFDRFTQVDSSATRSQGGLGLGLTISKELITLLGGTIDATSSEGEGTRITFTLPLWRGEAAA